MAMEERGYNIEKRGEGVNFSPPSVGFPTSHVLARVISLGQIFVPLFIMEKTLQFFQPNLHTTLVAQTQVGSKVEKLIVQLSIMGDGHVNEPRSKTKTAHVQNGRCFSRFACGTGHGTSSFQSIYFDFVCVCVWAEGKVGGSFPSVCFATSRHVERRPTSSRVLFFRHYDFFFISW
jgi:hypothetical protein